MNTLADMRRTLTKGTKVTVVNHRHPELSGERVVLKAQTTSWCLSFPPDHPMYDEYAGHGSWLTVPKAKDCQFHADGSVTITYDDGKPFCTLSVEP